MQDGGSVHPRACGELAVNSWPRLQWVGSSPRVRGTPLLPNRPCCSYRFIPARAGNSHDEQDTESASRRFIPARAGNSTTYLSATRRSPVHPRACGELGFLSSRRRARQRFIPARAGNSRGQASHQVFRRFIPARAGNSMHKALSDGLRPSVHPRACGELGREHGTVHPRRAGNSIVTGRWSAVHPRACGELLPIRSLECIEDWHGSSPRVRGTHQLAVWRFMACERFIPARAGNSCSRSQRKSGRICAGSSPRVRGTLSWKALRSIR